MRYATAPPPAGIRDAETTRAAWEVRPGEAITLHPKMPKLCVARVEPGWWFVAHGAPDFAARCDGKPWVAVSWLFYLEPLGHGRTRLISRFRSCASDDVLTRLQSGPYLTESVGVVMDRRMLLGVKERVERRKHEILAR